MVFCAVWIGIFCGCGRPDEITRYTVSVPQGPNDVQPTPASAGLHSDANAAASRMLAAIIPQDKQTWFFKLTGPDEDVAKLQEPFSALVESVRFDEATGRPSWKLPEGWRQQGASGMRFATIEITEGERKIELTVIPLDTRGDLEEYVRDNVNRWRGQLGLAPLEAILADGDGEGDAERDGDALSDVRQFKLTDTVVVTVVNLVGRGGGESMAGGLNASERLPSNHPPIDRLPSDHPPIEGLPSNHPPIDGASAGIAGERSDQDAGLTYATPDGWTPTNAGGLRRAAFQVSEGERKVEITVISLPQSGGERLANVNRWRNQIKLGDITAEQLAEDLRKIPVAEADGDYVELMGPAEQQPREAILAVLSDVAGSTWFFKLKGDADLAMRERERFQAFAQSVKFAPSSQVDDK